jgi:hypothetical protein
MKNKAVKGSHSLKMQGVDTGTTSKKPKVIIRRAAKQNSEIKIIEKEQVIMERDENGQVSVDPEIETSVPNLTIEKEPESLSESPSTNDSDQVSPMPTYPAISGFDLDVVSRNQQYVLRNMLVLCDCCVQSSPDGIFNVLARNFNDTGGVMWFMRKIGKSHIADLLKGKDVVDAVRKAAHELHRELKGEIGRPVARW